MRCPVGEDRRLLPRDSGAGLQRERSAVQRGRDRTGASPGPVGVRGAFASRRFERASVLLDFPRGKSGEREVVCCCSGVVGVMGGGGARFGRGRARGSSGPHRTPARGWSAGRGSAGAAAAGQPTSRQLRGAVLAGRPAARCDVTPGSCRPHRRAWGAACRPRRRRAPRAASPLVGLGRCATARVRWPRPDGRRFEDRRQPSLILGCRRARGDHREGIGQRRGDAAVALDRLGRPAGACRQSGHRAVVAEGAAAPAAAAATLQATAPRRAPRDILGAKARRSRRHARYVPALLDDGPWGSCGPVPLLSRHGAGRVVSDRPTAVAGRSGPGRGHRARVGFTREWAGGHRVR